MDQTKIAQQLRDLADQISLNAVVTDGPSSLPEPTREELTVYGIGHYAARCGVPISLAGALPGYAASTPNGTSWQEIVWGFMHHAKTQQELAQEQRDTQVNVAGVGFPKMDPHEVDAVLIYFDQWIAARPDVAWNGLTEREANALRNRGLTQDFIARYVGKFNVGSEGGSDPKDGQTRAHVE